MLIDKLTPERLTKEYHAENKSLSDIAKSVGCTRQYIHKLLKLYNIDRRDQLKGRALKNRFAINESFFSSWSQGMSYVLGLLFTDGCVQRNKNGKPTSIALSINDLSLLRKVRNLIGSNHKIYKLKQKGLYSLSFARRKILDDLGSLGLVPNKSKIIKFPNVPDNYVRDFIRGCWDGDGSVFFQYKKKLLMTFYVSGSNDFTNTLEDILNKKAHLTKRVIYRRPGGTSFYFKYAHKDSIKLFHYMYDGVKNHVFLERKYDKFMEGIYGSKST